MFAASLRLSPRGNSTEAEPVNLPRDAMLLRVFIGEDAKFQHRPLYQAIVLKAREVHLAGATVLRGPLGFGHSTRLHSTRILDVRENLPLVIEIVDTEDKIKAFLPVLDGMMPGGLVTLEKVQVLQYGEHVKHAPA
jgi:PII-like signaling protein